MTVFDDSSCFLTSTVSKVSNVNLSRNGKNVCCRLHRLVAIAFIPNPEEKPEANLDFDMNAKSNNLNWLLECRAFACNSPHIFGRFVELNKTTNQQIEYGNVRGGVTMSLGWSSG